MKKSKAHKITLSEAIQNIPHDEYYCNDSGHCPYWNMRYVTKNKFIELCKKGIIPQWRRDKKGYPLEYCIFLRSFLSIQDGCKDCEINCDIPKEVADDSKAFVEERRAEGEEPYASKDDEWLIKYGYMQKAYCSRIKNREAADFYKEQFPEESDLIDAIVEEDDLKYWYKDKN